MINATFTLEAQTSDTLPQPLKDALNLSADGKVTGVSYTIPGLDAHITEITDILSSTKVVKIQTINKVELNSSDYYCSWILNNKTEDDEYVLFAQGQETYQLKSGEYFLYTNNTRTSLIVLGTGTLLRRDTSVWSDEWACAASNYSAVISDGMDALVNTPNALQRVGGSSSSPAILEVVEQQFITLNRGATLVLTGTPSTAPAIKTLDGGNRYEYPISSDDFTAISYKGRDESDFNSLPLIDSSIGSWVLMCQLNINMSKEVPQILTDGQSMTLEPGTVSIVPNGSPVYVSSSFAVNMEGGVDVDVRKYNEDSEEWEVPKVAAFTLYDNTTEVTYTSSGEISIKYTSDGSEKTIPLSLHIPSGDYLLVVQHGNEALTGLYLYTGTKTILKKFGDTSSPTTDYLASPGTYYLDLNSQNAITSLGLKCTATSGDEVVIIIKECLRYTEYDNIPNVEPTDLVDKVQELNLNYLFDYSYQVDSDEIIKNPLDSMSFFELSHPYNKCTIGQLDTKSLDSIYVSEKIRS